MYSGASPKPELIERVVTGRVSSIKSHGGHSLSAHLQCVIPVNSCKASVPQSADMPASALEDSTSWAT